MIISHFLNQLGVRKNGRTLDTKKDTKDKCNQVGTGTRRTVAPNPANSRIVQYIFTANRQCYTQFFVGGQPPTGLRNDDAALRYICQPPKPNQVNTHYATMFDERSGIAVFSAYTLTQGTAGFPGQPADPDFYPTPGN